MTPGDPAVRSSWGSIIDAAMPLIEQGAAGNGVVDVSNLSTYTLTVASDAPDQARQAMLPFIGNLTTNCTVTMPSVARIGWATNGTSGGFNVILTTGSGNALTMPPGSSFLYTCDGSNVSAVTFGISAALNADPGVVIGNGSSYSAKDSTGAVKSLLQIGTDNWTNFTMGGASGLRFLNNIGQIAGSVSQAGVWTLSSGLNVSGPITANGTFNATGASVMGSTLSVAGAITAAGLGLTGNITANAATFAASLQGGTLVSTGGASIAGNETVGGTLHVAGITTLDSNVACNGVVHFSGVTTVSGFSGQLLYSAGVAPYSGTATFNAYCDTAFFSPQYFAGSDEWFKNDITYIKPEEGVQRVMKWRPARFRMKTTGQSRSGRIAQDAIEAGQGDSVTLAPYPGAPAHGDVPEGHALAMIPGDDCADLAAACQWLVKQVNALKMVVTTLEARLDNAAR